MQARAKGFASKADVVYRILYDEIKDGQLRPGARLVEQAIADRLGVSKTPVREALRMLGDQGLVEIEPYCGTYVSQFSISTLVEIMEIRGVLEGLASRKAASLIDSTQLSHLASLVARMGDTANEDNPQHWLELNWEFHGLIAEASQSPQLINTLAAFRQKMLLSSALGVATNIVHSLEEHRRLFEALTLHDPELAERVARNHIENTKTRVALLGTREGTEAPDGLAPTELPGRKKM